MKLQRLRIFGEFAIQIEKKRKKRRYIVIFNGHFIDWERIFLIEKITWNQIRKLIANERQNLIKLGCICVKISNKLDIRFRVTHFSWFIQCDFCVYERFEKKVSTCLDRVIVKWRFITNTHHSALQTTTRLFYSNIWIIFTLLDIVYLSAYFSVLCCYF